MSLKAKLEAVIYAAEEPVTLAQLALLFADEPWSGRRSRKPLAALAAKRLATGRLKHGLPLLSRGTPAAGEAGRLRG